MVEFAIVLPILILLTIGSIFLTMSFIQKSRMNAIAYMGARAAAVRQEAYQPTEQVKQRYQKKTGQNWVNKVSINTRETQKSGDRVTVELQKPAERLDILVNAIAIIEGESGYDPGTLHVRMVFPDEFYLLKDEFRPKTTTVVDYRYGGAISKIEEILDKLALPKAILNFDQMADNFSDEASKNKEISSVALNNLSIRSNTRLEGFFRDRNWEEALLENSEAIKGQFSSLQKIDRYFKEIEAGSDILGYLLEFVGFAGPLKAILGEVLEEGAHQAENGLSEVRTWSDKHNRQTFKKGIIE